MTDEYDGQCVGGSGTAPNVAGLLGQLTRPTDPTDVADFDALLAAVAAQVDGKWATSLRDVVTVTNPATYRLSAAAFRDVDAHRGDVAASAYLADRTGGWWTSSRMPAALASGDHANIAQGIVRRTGQTLTAAVHPVWGTMSVDDIYTDSASATRHFTVHVLVGDKVLLVQPSAFAMALFKVA